MAVEAVKVVTYVYGVDVSTMDKPSLLHSLKRVRAEIVDLNKGLEGVESTYVTSELARLVAAQAQILKLLDA